MGYDKYVSPLSERYASKEMQYIFSPDMKFKTWRKLWIALAETEKELGLNITDEQIAELKEHAEDINYDVAKAREKRKELLKKCAWENDWSVKAAELKADMGEWEKNER